MMIGYRRRQIRKFNIMMKGAWYNAMITRQERIPSLDLLLVDEEDKPKPEQSVEDMIAMAKMITIVNGGKIIKT